MTLIKTTLLSSVATVIKILSSIVINKAVALYIGPSGLALIGQFQNFSQAIQIISSGAINTGVTKYTSEYCSKEKSIQSLFSTSIKISFFFSILIGFCIIFFSDYIAVQLLKTDRYSYIFIIFGFTLIFFILNNYFLSILNGLKEIKMFISISIIQSIYSLCFTTLLIVFYSFDGALIAFVTNQSIVFIIIIWMLRKHKIINFNNFRGKFNIIEAKKLSKFMIMTLTSALSVPASYFIIRNQIGETLGWDVAGYWQALISISSLYLLIITTALSTYYLPKLSAINSIETLKKEIFNGYYIIIPIVCLLGMCLYMIREFIIIVLFTNDFLPMKEFFIYQICGDVLKISCFLIGYVLIAKEMTKIFIIKELVMSIFFVVISVILLKNYALEGVFFAYIITYISNLILLIIIFQNYTKKEKNV
ncbi:MAG: O-antigen translocase [Sulfurimonadaceae bacterium]|nr:O-antigen translocase [Candidatus Cloacimonadota bacterium]